MSFRTMPIALSLVLAPLSAEPCTTFFLSRGEERLVGKSYDWHMGQALVVVNKRGVAKQALPMMPGDRPASWVSRFASITFNQYGRELPNGGMNDAGLVVEVMWLDSSSYPPVDERPTVNELQWIQYQLDNFGSVAELLAAAEKIRASLVHGKVHYLACDRSGECAALEYLQGKLVVTRGEALAAKTLTNDTYADSVAFLRKHKPFGGKRAVPKGAGSLDRFVRASALAAEASTSSADEDAFRILDSVFVAGRSQWNIVYDPVRLRVRFRTLANKKAKQVELSRFEGACSSPARVLDIDLDAEGDVTDRFADYTDELNAKLVRKSMGKISSKLPAGAIEALIHYPAMLPCTPRPKPVSPRRSPGRSPRPRPDGSLRAR